MYTPCCYSVWPFSCAVLHVLHPFRIHVQLPCGAGLRGRVESYTNITEKYEPLEWVGRKWYEDDDADAVAIAPFFSDDDGTVHLILVFLFEEHEIYIVHRVAWTWGKKKKRNERSINKCLTNCKNNNIYKYNTWYNN